MRITDIRDTSVTQYLLDTPLKDVKSFKDLGVTISKGLSWDNHISITVNKANNLLGLIKRSVGTTNENSMLYLSLDKSRFRNPGIFCFCNPEYSSTIPDSH